MRCSRWVATLLVVFATMGAMGGAARGDDDPAKQPAPPPPVQRRLDSSVQPRSTILKTQGTRGTEANSVGGSAAVGAQAADNGSAQSGAAKSGSFGSKLWGWAKDHGKGLLMGLAVGAVVAGAILLAPFVLPALAMGTAITLAGTALTSAGLYGLMTGADRFSVTECLVLTGISVLGVVAGTGMAAAGIASRAAKWGKIALTALEGGVANAASYLITDPHPTAMGALQRFGVGMAFATGFMAVGNGIAKAYAGYKAARSLSHVSLEGIAGQVEGGVARGEAVVGGTSRAAFLERTQAMIDREASRTRVLANIQETRAARAASKYRLATPQKDLMANRHIELKEKFASLTRPEVSELIDELAGENYRRFLERELSQREYVYRYTTRQRLEGYLQSGRIDWQAYLTDVYSESSSEIMRGAQIKTGWAPPEVGIRIPTSALRNVQVPRPMGNKAPQGWELYTNSYPDAGPGHWLQFLSETETIDPSWVFSLKD